MALDIEFKDAASRVAALLVDLDLMMCEPYFTAEDIDCAVSSVSAQVDHILAAHRLTRSAFLERLQSDGVAHAAYFVRGVFAVLKTERST